MSEIVSSVKAEDWVSDCFFKQYSGFSYRAIQTEDDLLPDFLSFNKSDSNHITIHKDSTAQWLQRRFGTQKCVSPLSIPNHLSSLFLTINSTENERFYMILCTKRLNQSLQMHIQHNDLYLRSSDFEILAYFTFVFTLFNVGC